jgi:hypothetical protein
MAVRAVYIPPFAKDAKDGPPSFLGWLSVKWCAPAPIKSASDVVNSFTVTHEGAATKRARKS